MCEAASSESAALVQCDFDAIERWSIENKLPISLHKCSEIYYGAKNAKKAYTLGCQPVASVNECMDLSSARSNSFTYSKHIHAIAMRATRMAGMLIKIFSTRNAKF